jgi:hypothetical protein
VLGLPHAARRVDPGALVGPRRATRSSPKTATPGTSGRRRTSPATRPRAGSAA